MNRREFTASLAALVAAPAVPFAAVAPVAAPVAVPPGAYAWAQLIARAQNGCSPAALARHLRLSQGVADQLFRDMVADGVLRAPSVAGVARAANPIQMPSPTGKSVRQITDYARDYCQDVAREDHDTLVKAEHPRLGCDDIAQEDDSHACTDQPVQESPERG